MSETNTQPLARPAVTIFDQRGIGTSAGGVTVEMIAAVFESHRLGGQRVTLPLKTRQSPFDLF